MFWKLELSELRGISLGRSLGGHAKIMYPSQTVENIKTEWFPKAEHCKRCILPIYLDIIQLEEMN